MQAGKRKRIALLATGGTIASASGESGLRPAMRAEEILLHVPKLSSFADIRGLDVFSLDSSNIQPEEWRHLAKAASEALAEADGAIITHGTDTMAYTAAALSFMLLGTDKPVVLTGSQLPIDHPLSDAPGNLTEALSAALEAPGGVYVAFHHKLISGARAVKLRTTSFDAFDSVNAPLRGETDAEGLRLYPAPARALVPADMRGSEIDPRVFLLKLVPGTSPDVFDFVVNAGYKGLVVEAFGLGGLHYIRRNLKSKLLETAEKGVVTLVITQCLYEKADFTVYEVGRGVLGGRVYSGRDMTCEAAVAKLMWALGDPVKRLPALNMNLCGEMTVQE